MTCQNCGNEGVVKLRNNDGQVYEFRNCPICTCKSCGGKQYTEGWNPTPGLPKRMVPCRLCHPARFDAHVQLFRRLLRDHEKFMARQPDPSPEQLVCNAEQYENLYGKHGTRWALLRKLWGD